MYGFFDLVVMDGRLFPCHVGSTRMWYRRRSVSNRLSIIFYCVNPVNKNVMIRCF